MLKIGVAIAVLLAVGFIAFPELRAGITTLAPFALLALCPLGMLFGMKGMMGGNKRGEACSHCGQVNHSKEVHQKQSSS